MRKFIVGLTVISILQGCSTVSREAGYPGGNVGYLADRHTIFAQGQQQTINRYLVMLALLTPLAAETVKSSSEARLTAERIKVLYEDIDKLRAAAELCRLPSKLSDKATVQEIKLDECTEDQAATETGTAQTFETLSFDVMKSLSGVLEQSFDNLDIRSNARKTIALDPSEIMKTILNARRLIPILQRYLATYRDVALVFGQSVAESCATQETDNGELPKGCKQVAIQFNALINRTRVADSDVARDQRPINDVFKAGSGALNKGLDWKLTHQQRVSLLYHVNRACKKLDALAQIENEGYKGCIVDLKGSGKAPTQIAANNIIAAQETSQE